MVKISTLARNAAIAGLSVFFGLPVNAAERISDFSLIDSEGRFFQLSRQLDKQAVVLLSLIHI